MGTRGAFGFRIDGLDKVTYNHFDSYPQELGSNVIDDIIGSSVAHMKKVARAIVLIDRDEPPTPEEIAKNEKWANLEVSEQKLEDWYCLLREAQGSLAPWLDEELGVMIDSKGFLLDSLFCEYAYIVNLDDETFEFYRGFQHAPGAGRYGTLLPDRPHRDPESTYYGVALVSATPLSQLIGMDDAAKEALLDTLADEPEEDEEDGEEETCTATD
jgi:hypothetical protein